MEKMMIGGIDMWGNMLAVQSMTDQMYVKRHGVNFDELSDERALALIDELMEYAKETRSYHYWSTKEPSADHVRLEEAADVTHFYLSLWLQVGLTPQDFVDEYDRVDLLAEKKRDPKKMKSYYIKKAVKAAAKMDLAFEESSRALLRESFAHFWAALRVDGFVENDIERAYYIKNQKNRERKDHDL